MKRKLWVWALIGAALVLNALPGLAQAGIVWGGGQ
jgi:hypothetical protein